MKIALAPRGPMMWFLGTPKGNNTDVIALNFARPGPVELSPEVLSPDEIKHLINSLEAHQIVSDVSIADLKSLLSQKEVAAVVPVPINLKELTAKQQRILEDKLKLLHDSNQSAALYLVRHETSPNVLYAFEKTERLGKNRSVVLGLIEKRKKRICKYVVDAIRESAKQAPVPLSFPPVPDRNIVEDVVESDEQVVAIPLDLIRAVP